MLAKKGLIIFLVRNNSISHYSLNFAFDDFIEQYEQESRLLTDEDLKELQRIRQDPCLLNGSYLLKRLEPFLLPFLERRVFKQ